MKVTLEAGLLELSSVLGFWYVSTSGCEIMERTDNVETAHRNVPP